MNDDPELASWRADWRSATPPVPDLHGWIEQRKRRTRRDLVRALAGSLVMMAGYLALMHLRPMMELRALGLAGVTVFSAGIVVRLWRERRFARRPVESTRDFVEQAHQRVTAELELQRWSRRLLWIVPPLILSVGCWIWWRQDFRMSFGLGLLIGIVCASLAALALDRRRRRRTRTDLQEIERIRRELSL
jgi:hypothetical protein